MSPFQNRPPLIGNDSYDDDDDDYTESSTTPELAEAAEDQPPPEHSLGTIGRAATPSGSIQVRTTMQGLPTAIRIEAAAMEKSASNLAHTILLLCSTAGAQAGAAHRDALLAAGHPIEAVSYMNLPTADDVTRAENALDRHLETEPDTWMRRS